MTNKPRDHAVIDGDPFGETAIIEQVQAVAEKVPGSFDVARGMSFFGEHALGWLAIAGVGFVVDKKRRSQWFTMGTATFLAHAESVVIKRIVRRPRPHAPGIKIGVSTPSKLSFPSSHATSTTAAAISLKKITGKKWPLWAIPVMAVSRVILGVHYPTDVAAGTALGAGTAEVACGVEARSQ